jgi:hypothetical protein
MSTELEARAIGSCTDKTEGLFGIGGERMVDEILVTLEIAQKSLKKIDAMSRCCIDKNERIFWFWWGGM